MASSLPKTERFISDVPLCYRMHNCLDYSRCAFTSGFPVYLYDPEEYFPLWQVPMYMKTLVRQTISYNPHFTKDPRVACIYVVLIGESHNMNSTLLDTLPYWGGDGNFIAFLKSKNYE